MSIDLRFCEAHKRWQEDCIPCLRAALAEKEKEAQGLKAVILGSERIAKAIEGRNKT